MNLSAWGKGFAVAAIFALLTGACSGAASPAASTPASAAASAAASTAASTSPGPGGTIKIGGGFALTGDEASLDVPAANGAKLAVKEINAAGGVLGGQLELIIHDSQYKPDVTAQTAKQSAVTASAFGVASL